MGDAAVPALPLSSLAPSETASACLPSLGEPVAFDISGSVAVVPLPVGMLLMPVSFSADGTGTRTSFAARSLVLGYSSDS